MSEVGALFFPTLAAKTVSASLSLMAIFFGPQGYLTNAARSDSMTFNNATFARLGVTPGTYLWLWGTGLPNQNFTLIIPRVFDAGSTVSLLGFTLFGLAALR